MSKSLSASIGYVQEEIEKKLELFLESSLYKSQKLIEAIQYSTLQGGKRFRPFLLYYIGREFNIKEEVLFHIGATLEMIHTYTLVHDDLPAMDNDDTRRGKLSCHKKYNEATAILVGDSLLSEAIYFLSSTEYDVDAITKLKIINLTTNFCGAKNLITGQQLDIDFKITDNKDEDIKQLIEINLLKTAKFMVLICLIIGTLAKVEDKTFEFLGKYGETIGLLFQLVDDILDINEDEYSLGVLLTKEKAIIRAKELHNKANHYIDEIGVLIKQDISTLKEINNYIIKEI